MSRPFLARLSGALLLFLAGCGDPEPTHPRPRRIILVSMDTVRADHVSGYGAETMPTLAAIAAEGRLFQDFYAAANYTIPSHMSIFTGLDPAEHGVLLQSAQLSPAVPTLAEILKDAGFRTQAFHEGGYVAERFGFARGFDDYSESPRVSVVDERLPEILEWVRSAGEEPYFLFLHTYAAHYPYGGLDRYRESHPDRRVPSTAEAAAIRAELMKGSDGKLSPRDYYRYLLYNHLVQRHEEMLPLTDTWFPKRFQRRKEFEEDVTELVRSYDERIRLIDRALAALRRTLVELDQWEDTLLVVLSDHGEAFFEHGEQMHDFIPFNEVLKVPLVISYPRLLRGETAPAIEGVAWHLDVLPTVLELAGVNPPRELAGLSLVPAMVDRTEIPSDRRVFPAILRLAHMEQEPMRRVCIQGEQKWIQGHADFGDEQGLLFDLERDPEERENLRGARAQRHASFARSSEEYESALEAFAPVNQLTGEPLMKGDEAAPLSESERELLRSLGYIE